MKQLLNYCDQGRKNAVTQMAGDKIFKKPPVYNGTQIHHYYHQTGEKQRCRQSDPVAVNNGDDHRHTDEDKRYQIYTVRQNTLYAAFIRHQPDPCYKYGDDRKHRIQI